MSLSKTSKCFRFLFKVIENISMVMYMFSTILVTVNVITRYCFNYTIFGNEEISTYSILLMAFLMFAVIEGREQHLCVDLFQNACKNKIVLKIVYVIHGIVSIVANSIVSYYGYKVVQTAFKYQSGSPTLHIPKFAVFSVVLISFVLVVIIWLAILIFNKRRPL